MPKSFLASVRCRVKFLTLATIVTLGLAVSELPADLFQYNLHNSPDGGAQPPLYGFRLDGLFTGESSDIFTFDFDDSRIPNSERMRLDFDPHAQTARIFGTVFGGLNKNSGYDTDKYVGLFGIDFTFRQNISSTGSDDITVNPDDTQNNGKITFVTSFATTDLGEGDVINLVDFNGDPSKGYSFKFNRTDDHRLFGANDHTDDTADWMTAPLDTYGLLADANELWTGRGWVNHGVTDGAEAGTGSGYPAHISASDWLFVATSVPGPTPGSTPAVPEPSSLVLFALGTVGLVIMEQRRRKRKIAAS